MASMALTSTGMSQPEQILSKQCMTDRAYRAHPSSSYSDFLYALRLDLRATGFTYGLSCTLPRTRSSQDDFDIGRLQHSVDWINVMNYDLYVSLHKSTLPV